MKQWYEEVIRNIIDLIIENGTFHDYDEFKTVFNIRGIVLDFQWLLDRIPNVWRKLVRNNFQICIKMKYNITYPKHVKLLLKDRKACRIYYFLLNAKITPQIDGKEI